MSRYMKNLSGAAEVEKYPANSREIQTIEFLAGMDTQLRRGEECLEDRIRKYPNDWRMYRAAMKMIEKVLEHVYDTLEPHVLRHMLKLSESGEVVVRPRPIRPDYVQIVANEDLKKMVNIVLADECAMCGKYERSEWKPCEIRKMLFRIAPPFEVNLKTSAICPYMDVCMKGDGGNYFTAVGKGKDDAQC